MCISRKLGAFATALCGLFLSVAFPTAGHALFNGTYDITTTNFGIVCSPKCGTVEVTGDGTSSITFDVQITQANLQIHGINETFAFNISKDGGTVVIDGVTNGGTWSTTLLSSGVGQQDGYGDFTDAVECNGPSGGNFCGTRLKFTVSSGDASNLFLSLGSGGYLFTVKLTTTNLDTQVTGFASTPGPILGTGVSSVLLLGAGLVGWVRRRRKARLA